MAHKYEKLDIAELRSVFAYDENTGVITREGRQTGSRDGQGRYRVIYYRGLRIPAHVLAWVLKVGEWPKNQVDHRDRDGLNNEWQNLREATAAQQQVNRRLRSASGLRGVRHATRGDGWWAEATVNGKAKHLGTYPTAEAAFAVAEEFRLKTWGEFATS